jgi:hypothetical protein
MKKYVHSQTRNLPKQKIKERVNSRKPCMPLSKKRILYYVLRATFLASHEDSFRRV